jgi:hypothetical protein
VARLDLGGPCCAPFVAGSPCRVHVARQVEHLEVPRPLDFVRNLAAELGEGKERTLSSVRRWHNQVKTGARRP